MVLAVIQDGEVCAGNLQLLQLLFGEVAAGIGDNLVAHFIHSVILD